MNSYSTLLALTATPACRRTLYPAFCYSSVLTSFCEAIQVLTGSIKHYSPVPQQACPFATPTSIRELAAPFAANALSNSK